MNWADTVKATALAALAGRTATAGRVSVDPPWSWNPHAVWLTPMQQPRELETPSALSGTTTQPRQGTALRE